MLTEAENISKYAIKKSDIEARKTQRWKALEKLNSFFESDNMAFFLREPILEKRISSSYAENLFCKEEDVPGGVIISKDTISQLLIRKGYERWWKREKKDGLMYFYASDGIQLPAGLIKVNKDVKKNSFLFTVFPAIEIVKAVEWALAMEIYMKK